MHAMVVLRGAWQPRCEVGREYSRPVPLFPIAGWLGLVRPIVVWRALAGCRLGSANHTPLN